MKSPGISKSTPVLFVDAIEPSLAFWRDRLGFAVTVEVPDGERLGFAILAAGTVEVMYQSVATLHRDSPTHAAQFHNDKSFLFVEVDDINALAHALDGCEMMTPRHETFYGSTEIAYREPGGHFVTFAQFKR